MTPIKDRPSQGDRRIGCKGIKCSTERSTFDDDNSYNVEKLLTPVATADERDTNYHQHETANESPQFLPTLDTDDDCNLLFEDESPFAEFERDYFKA